MASLVLVLAVLLAACGDPAGPPGDPSTEGGPSPSPTTQVSAGPRTEWLAVFRVERDPEELEADTQEFLELVGHFIFVGPVSCFEGLPAGYASPGDAYALAVVAETEQELEHAIGLTGREPLFRRRVTSWCVD
jgi:hypothetical protein